MAGLPGEALPADPASLASVDGELLSLAWRLAVPNVKSQGESLVDGPINALDMTVAMSQRHGEIRLGAGFAMYLPLPDLIDTQIHVDLYEVQAPLLEDALDFTTFDLAGAIGWGPLELGVGAAVGMDLVANTTARVYDLTGEATDQGVDVSDGVAVGLERALVWRATPLVSLHFRHPRFDAIASYRGQMGFETQGDNTLALDLNFPGIETEDIELEVNYLSAWSPARWTVAAAVPMGRVHPEFSLRWLRTSRFVDGQVREPDPPFRDVLIPAIGLEVDLGRGFQARAGYAFHPSPIPLQEGGALLADANRHVAGLGLGCHLGHWPRMGDHSELQLALQGHDLVPRDIAVGGPRIFGEIWAVSLGLATEF